MRILNRIFNLSRVVLSNNTNINAIIKPGNQYRFGTLANDRISSNNNATGCCCCWRVQSNNRLWTSSRAVEGPGGRQHYSVIAQKTVTPKKKMTKLTEQERAEQLQPILDAGWSMVSGRDAIYKEYLFSDFNHAFSFMAGVALLAEKMNHHPEWFNVYNKVQVTMSTHDVGGVSAKDVRMAKYMEEHAKRLL